MTRLPRRPRPATGRGRLHQCLARATSAAKSPPVVRTPEVARFRGRPEPVMASHLRVRAQGPRHGDFVLRTVRHVLGGDHLLRCIPLFGPAPHSGRRVERMGTRASRHMPAARNHEQPVELRDIPESRADMGAALVEQDPAVVLDGQGSLRRGRRRAPALSRCTGCRSGTIPVARPAPCRVSRGRPTPGRSRRTPAAPAPAPPRVRRTALASGSRAPPRTSEGTAWRTGRRGRTPRACAR